MRNAITGRSSYLGYPSGLFRSVDLMKLNDIMKKFLVLGAFAFFAFAASAQSTEAPADKKAKTEQTCAKDANKPACSSTEKAACSKDKAATGSCCSKSAGASASTDAKGASCSKSEAAGCCSKSASADTKDKKSAKKGNKTSGLSGGN